MLNREKLLWGLLLLGVGIVILLQNLGVISFYWRPVFRLWPLIIIIIGVNLLLPRKGTGNLVAVLFTAAAVAFLIFTGVEGRKFSPFSTSEHLTERTFRQFTDPEISAARLNVSGGAVTYKIIPSEAEDLFLAETESTFGSHHFSYKTDDSLGIVDFKMDTGSKGVKLGGDDYNKVEMQLQPELPWQINFSMGAGTADFDLRSNRISRLVINGGAAAIKAKLGSPEQKSRIVVSGGATNVKLEIPTSAQCRISVSTALSSRNFAGFTKISDGSFVTPGFDSSLPHYEIRFSGGMSSFSVARISE